MTRRPLAAALLTVALPAAAGTNTAAITASVMAPDCLQYRIVGICYWLFCTPFGCSVKTSVKVRHYVPDAVVSSYANTGDNPWSEMSVLGLPTPLAQAGGDGTTNHVGENNLAKFKEADVIGHPGAALFRQFARSFGYACPSASTPFVPYFLSSLDVLAWRYGLPEMVYPESLIPGRREVGSTQSGNLWGNLYPRSGSLHQADDYKTAAVIAQRAGDITTRSGQPHVYRSLRAKAKDGYWPAGALKEGDASTGQWQRLSPELSQSCAVFPERESHAESPDGGYAWALWRPYACCKRAGQTFLGSTDFP